MSKKFSTAPRNDARPLGTKSPKAAKGSKENSTAAKKVVDFPTPAAVQSESREKTPEPNDSEPVNENPANEEKPKMILQRDTAPRKGNAIVFKIPGSRFTVYVSKSAFGGNVPDSLAVEGEPFAPSGPKAKLSKEERAAARAAETPEQKLQAQRDRIARQQAKLAKLEAAAAAPATVTT